MSHEVAVTGLGLVSPAGAGTEQSWQGVCAGVGTATEDPTLASAAVGISCRVPPYDADAEFGASEAWRLDRFVQLALLAAREAVSDSGLEPARWDGTRVGVVIGSAAGGVATLESQHAGFLERGPKGVSALFHPMALVNMVSGRLAIEFGATGPNLVTATACASGATAIGVARDLLVSGACDVVIAGGTEAAISPTFVTGFARMGALSRRSGRPSGVSRPFDVNRDGFVIGEGAGVLVLESVDHARRRGADVRARLVGYGASADASHVTAPHPQGRGIEQAMRRACADAGLPLERVGHINAHGTSTQLNDAVEADAIHRLFGAGVPVTSTKGVTGHTLGAAGAIEAALTVLSLSRQTLPPTANLEQLDPAIALDVVAGGPRPVAASYALTNSAGFGGHNVSLAFAV